MARLAAFVDWVGSGRKLTDSGRIRLRDIPELVEVLRLGVLPAGFAPRSSSDLPELDWTHALADAGLLVDVTRRGLLTTQLGREMRNRPLDAWKSVFEGLFDAGAVTWLRGAKAWQPPWAQMLDDGLPDLLVLSYLGRDQGLLAEEAVELHHQPRARDRSGCPGADRGPVRSRGRGAFPGPPRPDSPRHLGGEPPPSRRRS